MTEASKKPVGLLRRKGQHQTVFTSCCTTESFRNHEKTHKLKTTSPSAGKLYLQTSASEVLQKFHETREQWDWVYNKAGKTHRRVLKHKFRTQKPVRTPKVLDSDLKLAKSSPELGKHQRLLTARGPTARINALLNCLNDEIQKSDDTY
jgi:hypothetical protein